MTKSDYWMVDKMPEAYRITSTKILDWMPLGVIMQTPRPLLMDSVDVAVIGSGIAGLFLAVRCAKAGLKVAVITKKEISTSSTNWAQGGIAGVLDTENKESLEMHVKDTLECGGGHCDEDIVRSVVNEAADRINDLVKHGVKFDIGSEGEYDLNREGGHSDNRILHAKDRTGAEIERALTEDANAKIDDNFKILENWMAVDLIQKEYGDIRKGVSGVWCLDPSGLVHTLPATNVVLATGGSGMLYKRTTNPVVATGDGVAMAKRTGVDIRDMEFFQFHPTAIGLDSEGTFLITEALRGHGAILMTISEYEEWKNDGKSNNPDNLSYMHNYSPLGSLGTRDVVARATDAEMKKSGDKNVLLVTEHLDTESLVTEFPTITEKLEAYGIKMGFDAIPVTPAAHYMVGGVAVNYEGRTKSKGHIINNLYAIGEVACTGLHGANRLASNSLLEAVVYSNRAAEDIINNIDLGQKNRINSTPMWRADDLDVLIEHSPLRTDLEALRVTMSSDVGIVKSYTRLQRAKRRIQHISDEVEMIWKSCKPTQDLVELRNLIDVAKLVVMGSISRDKNVGLHYNKDLEN
ncbi:MAG: L-aspartate oxidase [Candidatus Thalassarchaeaceae archaeon]